MTVINATIFKRETNTLLEAIDTCSNMMEHLSHLSDLATIVDESNALGGSVTVMEPMVLSVRLKQLLAKIKDIELISDIQRIDPERTLTGETGQSWYALAKGDLTITAIKELRSAIRNSFKQPNFDVAEAKRICELVKEGKI